MYYQTILFDLDGTLTDPGVGITDSVAYALSKYQIRVENRQELYPFIGPPLMTSFQEFYGFSEKQAAEAVGYYREYYRETGIYGNYVYEGIPETLETLKTAGGKLLVATSKPEEFARRIIEHYQLAEYFTYVAGATMDNKTRSTKAEVIRYALESCGITDLSHSIMVGDRKHDILGAAQCGMDSLGVLFGYGNREELEAAGATYIAEKPSDIGTILCKIQEK